MQHRARQPNGAWLVTDLGADDVIALPSMGIEVPVAAFYASLVALGGPARDALPVIARTRAP